MNICIYGASSDNINQTYKDAVFGLGQAMATKGHILVFGGGTSGLMGSAVRGIQSVGGFSVGIAPRFFDKPGILHNSCNEFIFTDTMRERKRIMEERSDAFIAVPGGIGTFEELFEILTLKQLGRHRKPVALFNINGYYDSLCEMMNHASREGFMRPGSENILPVYDNISSLLDYIEKEATR